MLSLNLFNWFYHLRIKWTSTYLRNDWMMNEYLITSTWRKILPTTTLGFDRSSTSLLVVRSPGEMRARISLWLLSNCWWYCVMMGVYWYILVQYSWSWSSVEYTARLMNGLICVKNECGLCFLSSNNPLILKLKSEVSCVDEVAATACILAPWNSMVNVRS